MPAGLAELPEKPACRDRGETLRVGGFTTFQLSDDGSLILLSLSGKLYIVERATKKVSELPPAEAAE